MGVGTRALADLDNDDADNVVSADSDSSAISLNELDFKVVRTGQTICYSNEDVTECDGTDFPGQDGYFAPVFNENRFSEIADDDSAVKDSETGFIWKKNAGQTLSSQTPLCQSTNEAGWRVPTAHEIRSIVNYQLDKSGGNLALISPPFLVLNPNSFAWTANTGIAVELLTGAFIKKSSTEKGYNICIYSGNTTKTGSSRFNKEQSSWLDSYTGKSWETEIASQKNWAEILQF